MNNGNRKKGSPSRMPGEPAAGGHRLLAATTVLIATVAGTLAADGTDLAYDTHRIDTGEADARRLLAGRLTGGTTGDLVVFSVSGKTTSVGVYAHVGDTFARVQLAEVPGEMWDFDLARLGGEVALLGFGSGGRPVRSDNRELRAFGVAPGAVRQDGLPSGSDRTR